jgi:hypothetical protein
MTEQIALARFRELLQRCNRDTAGPAHLLQVAHRLFFKQQRRFRA